MEGGAELETSWNFRRPIGQLRGGSLSGRVDVEHPEQGLHAFSVNRQTFSGPLLCVSRHDDRPQLSALAGSLSAWPLPLADAYVRGSDLVAAYKPVADWPYAPQIYWRSETIDTVDELGTLSLLVSVQTHLLDTRPRIRVGSRLAADEALHITVGVGDQPRVDLLSGERETTFCPSGETCCILRRLRTPDLSCAEIMPASDFRQLTVQRSTDQAYEAHWELFAEFLEKGVIRRARLQTVFLRRENDVERAVELCRAIQQRPLPLTT